MTTPEVFPDPDISWYAFYVVIKLELEGGIASTKYDMVGHSMGGILERHEFRQTPGVNLYHGVEKFNAMLDKAFSKDRSMQAVKDLAENSPAIQKLAAGGWAMLGIPTCTVGSEIEEWGVDMVVKEFKEPKSTSFIKRGEASQRCRLHP